MKVEVRSLFGETFKVWKLTITADEVEAYRKLFKAAARLVRDLNPGSVQVSGITWDEANDQFVMYLTLSNSQ